MQGRQVDEPRLLLAREDVRPEADLAAHLVQELLAVLRLAHGGGGRGQELVHALGVGQALVLAQRVQAPSHGLGGEPAAGERALAQPHHLLLALDQVEAARPRLHDHHVEGVAAHVDGGDPHPPRILRETCDVPGSGGGRRSSSWDRRKSHVSITTSSRLG